MAYRSEIISSNHRRASWHNYYGPATYMVTVTKTRGCADFGRLEMKNIADAEITPSFLGTVIEEEIDATPSHHPQIKVLECALMPDHVHVLMEATAALDIHFGEIVRVIKAAATSRIRKMCANPSLTVFNEGFHDRIVLGADQLSTLFRYLRDNPRRLAVRRAHPEYFRRVNKLQLCGRECMAYGNFQLLDNPFKEAVVVHRADSDAVRGEKSGLWHYTAANGGVLVSPFISEAEKGRPRRCRSLRRQSDPSHRRAPWRALQTRRA